MFLDEIRNHVAVYGDGKLILESNELPVEELKKQISEWIDTVNDYANYQCFVFSPKDPALIGSFRIEPRPNGWQFTSMWEKRRSEEIITLADWQTIIRGALG